MAIALSTPGVDGLAEAVNVLREWQYEGAPPQLHPGDLGWFWRSGAEATAAAVRTWSRAGRILAIGLLDGPDLLRLTTAPDVHQDEELARRLVADVTDTTRGVLPPSGRVNIEAPPDTLFPALLADEEGWPADDPWTPLRRDLTAPVRLPDLRVEEVGPAQAHTYAAVLGAAFDGSKFTVDRWQAMASGLPYTDARCLLAYDDGGDAVAAVTVWSAGPGRPGLLEPMGVHRDHRRRGHGEQITLAAAAALRAMGASSALVATPSSNTAAVATYESAGFERRTETRDRYRDT
ncbi:GNAT family N-acetyltransferase [Streptomyces sp. Je 1-369]|uniref:GNAT family N-acetyltransferase n=1 Tax=Streptomyces sp. Je 1-369 TaxID=2966192 RepID=UPI0022855F62|nr:GNAT family N-acetyltransferase [Streptomyces sp. Je 1-369]WAL96322.1 GNAT family N-acetyltransferase [Streptomyces sp. Je 1-369]